MMLLPDGRLKLLDFGIAKASIDNRLTVTGTTLGSLYYMSPEQIQGGQVDVRSDVYSVGVSLYELVTGKKPFDAESQFAIMSAHLARAPVPPLELNPNLPPAVSETILVALAKEPNQRFQTAGEFLLALREVQAEVGLGAGTSLDVQPMLPQPTALRRTSLPIPPPLTTRPPVPPPAAVQTAPTQLMPPPAPRTEPRYEDEPRKKSGPRLVWVAVGSLCAVGAIIAFIQFGPKGQTSAKDPAPVAGFVPPYPGGGTSNGNSKPSAMPVSAAKPSAATDRGKQTSSRQAPQVQAPPAQQPNSAPPASAPAPVQQQTPPAAPVSGGPPSPIAGADRSEVQKLNEKLGVIYGRARSVRDALSADGGNAHPELVDSFNRMNAYLKQATTGINDGNVASAADAMGKAEHELLNLEKSLGK
jgi:serine/threonine-protein kinase